MAQTVDGAADLATGDGPHALGVTRVANEVVARIAALTALQVPGIHAMYQAGGQSFERILRRSLAHRGARVQLRDDHALVIDLWVVLVSGNAVAHVGAEIQQRVADAVDRMLGLEVAAINVHISEVVFSA
ncbi:MAG: Asp23/Gls24 family envelope stress response protein [Candidatus Dormibacteria bacterium]|jgi:uncharacterized alkaline shock family protein YloU